MTEFRFCWFDDYEDGKLARLETIESEIPVNIFAEPDSDFDLEEGDRCSVEIFGVGNDVRFFPDEEAFDASGTYMAAVSMIPMGTFPADPEKEDFQQSPHILFAGRVMEVEMNPEAGPDEPNYCVTVETLEMTVNVFLRSEEAIAVGGILSGVAWIYGDILKDEDECD